MVGIFISKCFFILTVIVYLDTIGCVIAKMLSVTVYLDTIGCVMAKMLNVYLREWNKRLFLLTGVTGSRKK